VTALQSMKGSPRRAFLLSGPLAPMASLGALR